MKEPNFNSFSCDNFFPTDDGKYCIWDKVYNRKCIPNLSEARYINCCYSEDYALNAFLFKNAKNKFSLNKILYHYIHNKNSACQKKRIDVSKLINFNPLLDSINLYKNNKIVQNVLYFCLLGHLNKLILQISISFNYGAKRNYYKNIIKRLPYGFLLFLNDQNLNLKTRLLYFFLRKKCFLLVTVCSIIYFYLKK